MLDIIIKIYIYINISWYNIYNIYKMNYCENKYNNRENRVLKK